MRKLCDSLAAVYLTRHLTPDGSRWALGHHFLPSHLTLAALLQRPRGEMAASLVMTGIGDGGLFGSL